MKFKKILNILRGSLGQLKDNLSDITELKEKIPEITQYLALVGKRLYKNII